MLSPNERARYDRQLGLRGFGEQGQEKLKKAKVVVAGAGGLGSASLTYLAEAGVGTIRIIDCDTVEISNLNRQILHWHEDIGRRKVDSASEKLGKLNPKIDIEPVHEKITGSNVSQLIDGFHLIVDAVDNLPARYSLNHEAIRRSIPFFHGAISEFEGRVMTIIPGETACLHCLYRGRVPKGKMPVVGVIPAVIGNIQATEVIKHILGIGKLLTDRLLVFDGLQSVFSEFKVLKNPECSACGL